jgi:N-acetyl-alpha-D-muramate 1-phosphate uridylyltransferase
MDAFLLAAGRGERLRPITDHVPKPLLEVAGKPLIEWHVERLYRAGFRRIIVNVCWLGEQIMSHLGDGSRFDLDIVYSIEAPGALETAGGIVQALPLLRGETFVLVSADIWTEFDFAILCPEQGSDAGLVMVDNPAHHPRGDFVLAGNRLQLHGDGRSTLTYAGIGWYRRALFEPLQPGFRPLRPILDGAIASGRVRGCRFRGRWLDIGSPERLRQATEMANETSTTTRNNL